MNRNKEFVVNTILLLIGKFATQFMSFLLLPLFTHYLITKDYGYIDLIQTYIVLFVPILTLRLDSVTFRYLIDCRNDINKQKNVISNIVYLLLFSLFITILISIVIGLLFDIESFLFIVLCIVISMISGVFIQLLRGLGDNKGYSIASILTGFSNLVINIVLILVFHFNATSILISTIASNFLCIIFVCLRVNIFERIGSPLDKTMMRKMLKYSIPLIPHSLSWWVVNVSDRTIITVFLGSALNGIYSVSCKFSNILNSIFSIFNMSWQETASLHINDIDAKEFLTNIINKLLDAFNCASLIILSAIPIAFNILIGKDYVLSYNYIPILLYANTWNVIIGLIGGVYVALKKTKEIAMTTIVSAIINIITHFVLIKFVGLYAAAISTLISYFVMAIYRYIDCQKYIKININIKSIIVFTCIYLIASMVYLLNNLYLNIMCFILVIVYSLIINKKVFLYLFKFVNRKKNAIME